MPTGTEAGLVLVMSVFVGNWMNVLKASLVLCPVIFQ